jgi:DNA-binding IclR family transcriptional regulator
MSNDKVEAVERALAILDAFHADKPAMTLRELAAATGFYKSTILRLAGSLERRSYLVRQESGQFRLGPAPWRLGSIYRLGFNLGDAIRPELGRLVDATGETASFYVREGDKRVCLFRHNSPQTARHHLDEGTELPLTAGASAHVLTTFSDEEAKPSAKAKQIRERGYYISLGERDAQVAAVAVPVFDLAGGFLGALAISGLIGRFKDKARQSALTELQASAERLRALIPGRE